MVHERNRARGGKVNDLQVPGTLGLRGSPGSGNRCLMRGQTRPDTERVISGQNASENGKGERVQVFRAEHGGKSLNGEGSPSALVLSFTEWLISVKQAAMRGMNGPPRL